MALHQTAKVLFSWDTVETMRGADSQKPNRVCSAPLKCSESLKRAKKPKKFLHTYQTSSGVFLDIFTYLELELSYMCS